MAVLTAHATALSCLSRGVSSGASLLAFVLWFVRETVLRGKLEAHEAVAQLRSVAVLTAHATALSCRVTRCVLCPRIASATGPLCWLSSFGL